MKRRITICLIVLAITITSFPLPVSAASKTKSRYMPTEYYVKYKYAHDGVSAEYARLKYNKYGLVTKMTITSYDEDGNKSDYISTDTFKYTYYKNKNVKTIAALRGDNKEADFIMYFNKYGAMTKVKWGSYQPVNIKGKAAYYSGTHKIKNLETSYKEEYSGAIIKSQFRFNKAGYLTKRSRSDGNTKYTYDKKGRLTKKSYKDDAGFTSVSKYKYTFKNGRVASRKLYYTEKRDGETSTIVPFSTITVKKWKKVSVNESRLRAGRCMAAVYCGLIDDEYFADTLIPTFVFEWK